MKLTDTIKRKIGEYWFKLKQRGLSDDAIISKIYSNYGILISLPTLIGVNPMHKVNLRMVEGALKSPKTPKHLKAGLLKKYGYLLKGFKGYSALASTVQANPKKKNPSYGYGHKHWDDFSTEGANEDISDSWDEIGRHIPCRDKNPKLPSERVIEKIRKLSGCTRDEAIRYWWSLHKMNPAFRKRPSEGDVISIPRFGTFMVVATYSRGIDLQHTGTYKKISITWKQLRVSKYKMLSRG